MMLHWRNKITRNKNMQNILPLKLLVFYLDISLKSEDGQSLWFVYYTTSYRQLEPNKQAAPLLLCVRLCGHVRFEKLEFFYVRSLSAHQSRTLGSANLMY